MFYAEDKILRHCAPHLSAVLVLDPFPAASRLLCDLLKQLGARVVVSASSADVAERQLSVHEPKLIFCEYGGGVDGPDFVRRLRRGASPARRAPVIMCTAEATELSLKAARDSGVHEFLCKPFTVAHVVKRVEAACLKEREWIDARFYVGPDRRRFNSAGYGGPLKRSADKAREAEEAPATADLGVLPGVLMNIKTALARFDEAPQAAIRSMVEQSAELQQLAFASDDDALRRAVAALQRYLLAALETNTLSRAELAGHADALARFAPPAGPPTRRVAA